MENASPILVADDNRDNAESLVELLRVLGYEAHAAFDGSEAVELCGRLQPRVAILDIQMPVLDGAAAARLMRLKMNGKIIIASMTGLHSSDAYMVEISHLFDKHLLKPASIEELIDFLNQVSTTTRGACADFKPCAPLVSSPEHEPGQY